MRVALVVFSSLLALCLAMGCNTDPTPQQGPPGASGSTGSMGPSGPPGNVGQTGANGSTGAAGAVGATGAAGTDLTPITIVDFCPGTTSYPSTFIEIGFCIDGNVYGTYSANDGFSSLLPPGTYASDAIGSSCNFTIGANCAITH